MLGAGHRVRLGDGREVLVRAARSGAGLTHIEADILRDNFAAIKLASKLGASPGISPNGRALVRVSRALSAPAGTATQAGCKKIHSPDFAPGIRNRRIRANSVSQQSVSVQVSVRRVWDTSAA
jgi:hypothetical protein